MSFQYTSGDPSHLTGGANASMADIQGPFTDLRTFLNARIAAIPTLVSALPVSPVDAQEIYFQADAANGVIWHLRYRAASASASKWEFVGGSPMGSRVDAVANVNTAPYGDFAGPSLVVPVAGDYECTFGAADAAVGAGATVTLGLNVAGVAPTAIVDEARISVSGSFSGPLYNTRLKTTTAGATIKVQAKVGAAAVNVQGRYLVVRPVRVG